MNTSAFKEFAVVILVLAGLIILVVLGGCESKADIAREAWRDEMQSRLDVGRPVPRIGLVARYADGSEYTCRSMEGKFTGLPYTYPPESLNRNRAAFVWALMPEHWAALDKFYHRNEKTIDLDEEFGPANHPVDYYGRAIYSSDGLKWPQHRRPFVGFGHSDRLPEWFKIEAKNAENP